MRRAVRAGGIVRRDGLGRVIIGRQYQSHNPRDGPVYAGGGYTPTSLAIHEGAAALAGLLDEFPELINDVSTGGARPLHVCGMSRRGQLATQLLIDRGADIEAVDTYGYTVRGTRVHHVSSMIANEAFAHQHNSRAAVRVCTRTTQPLHRMASNNLAAGAEALLAAGANANTQTWGGDTALDVALASDARAVVEVLRRYDAATSGE